MLENFVEALDYLMYRFRKKVYYFGRHGVSNVEKLVKKLRLQLKETSFDESYSISILAFLKELRYICNSICVHKRVAVLLLSIS